VRIHLLFLSLLLAILAGFAALTGRFGAVNLLGASQSQEDLTAFVKSFQNRHVPITEVNFAEIYGSGGQFRILHPLLGVPRNLTLSKETCQAPDRAEAANMTSEQERCCRAEAAGFTSFDLDQTRLKKKALLDFLAEGRIPPESFLTSPPWIDESGTSFAYLLEQRNIAPFNDVSGVVHNLSYFKVSELKEILNKYHIGIRPFSVIANLSEAEIEDLIKGDPVVLTADYLMIKNQSQYGFSPLSYWAYRLEDAQNDLKNGPYEMSKASSGALCLQKTGNLCWSYNSRHALTYVYRYSLIALTATGLLFLAFLSFYLFFLYRKHQEQKQNRLALQVLSHEFRTPVASMLLIIENLSANLQKYSNADQDQITRLATETYRLQRIIEVSKNYLQTSSGRLHFNWIEIASINTWIADFISELDLRVECRGLSTDRSLRADPFWLKFVLSNLVQNAFSHGKSPVRIHLKEHCKQIQISIEDEGTCNFSSLQEMTAAFVKSPMSGGMGLGLNITNNIIEAWGGKMHFSKNPTAFTFTCAEQEIGRP